MTRRSIARHPSRPTEVVDAPDVARSKRRHRVAVWPLAIEKCDGGHIIEPSPTTRYRAARVSVPLALNWTASRATLNVTIAALALGTLPSPPTPGRLPEERAVTAPASP